MTRLTSEVSVSLKQTMSQSWDNFGNVFVYDMALWDHGACVSLPGLWSSPDCQVHFGGGGQGFPFMGAHFLPNGEGPLTPTGAPILMDFS